MGAIREIENRPMRGRVLVLGFGCIIELEKEGGKSGRSHGIKGNIVGVKVERNALK